jgi:hypothetical protein
MWRTQIPDGQLLQDPLQDLTAGRVGPRMIDHYSSFLRSQVGLTNMLVRTPFDCLVTADESVDDTYWASEGN